MLPDDRERRGQSPTMLYLLCSSQHQLFCGTAEALCCGWRTQASRCPPAAETSGRQRTTDIYIDFERVEHGLHIQPQRAFGEVAAREMHSDRLHRLGIKPP